MRLIAALALVGAARAAEPVPASKAAAAAAPAKPFWDPAFAPMVSPMFWDHSKVRSSCGGEGEGRWWWCGEAHAHLAPPPRPAVSQNPAANQKADPKNPYTQARSPQSPALQHSC